MRSLRWPAMRWLVIDWYIVRIVHAQALHTLASSPSSYVPLALGVAGALVTVRNTLAVVRDGYLTVLSEPFVPPLLGMALIGSLFLALIAGLAIAREREFGTLETVFYGPVRHLEFMLGKFLAHLTGYILMIVAFLGMCAALSMMMHLALSPLLLAGAALSVTTAAALIGAGLLVATLMRTIRGTLLLCLALLCGFLALNLGTAILASIVSSRNFTSLILLRDSLTALDGVVAWLSPTAYLARGIDAASRGNWYEWASYGVAALVYGLAMVVLAGARLRQKGVIR